MSKIEQTRAVIDDEETYDGTLVPTVKGELSRSVRVRDEAVVEGSVYGGTVQLFAGSTVEGSIMASESIEVEAGRVYSEVGTPGRVLAEDSQFDGSVTGKRVRLSDCVVCGNLAGTHVSVENCLVIGIVSADRELTLENSLCYTFRSHGSTTIDDATIVLPQAIADGNVTFRSPVRVAGLGSLDSEDDADQLPEMTERDLYEQGGTTYLTLSPRILNLEKVSDRLDDLDSAIQRAVSKKIDRPDAGVNPVEFLDDIDVEEDYF